MPHTIDIAVGLSSAIVTGVIGYVAHYSIYKAHRERRALAEDELIGHEAGPGIEAKLSISARLRLVERLLSEVRAVLHMNGPGSDVIAARVIAQAVEQAAELLAEAKVTAQAKLLADALVATPPGTDPDVP